MDDYLGLECTQAKTNAPISKTSSEDLKLITQTYQMRNKELKMKLGQLQERKYKKLVLIYATTINQLFWKLTKEQFTLHEVNFGGATKI